LIAIITGGKNNLFNAIGYNIYFNFAFSDANAGILKASDL